MRKRWRLDPVALVDDLHSVLEREKTAKQRREEAKRKLEVGVYFRTLKILKNLIVCLKRLVQ